MVGLLDVAPSTRVIRVNGVDVSILGVSATGIAALLISYPALKDVFTGGLASVKVDATTLAEVAPGAIAAIIAAGCGNPGDPAAIKIADELPVGKQVELLSAIVELTMPDGIGPFLQALDATLDRLNFADRGKAPATK